MFGFSIVKPPFSFTDLKTITIPAICSVSKNDNSSAIADHVKATGHNVKWDYFDILAKGKTDYCEIKRPYL